MAEVDMNGLTNTRPPAHFLSEVNIDDRTALCCVCGPVKVVSAGVRNGKKQWRCSQAPHVQRHNQRPPRQDRYDVAREAAREALIEVQGGELCAICGDRPGERSLAVDHDHETRRVRGLLCIPCNRGLGFFEDNPEILSAAIEYLSSPPGDELEEQFEVRHR